VVWQIPIPDAGIQYEPGERAQQDPVRLVRWRLGTALGAIPFLFAYNGDVPSRRCTVSFTDSTGVTHAVEVAAASLFEAAALALAEFRRCGFADAAVGVGTSLAVTVQQPTTMHTLRMAGLQAWLNSSGKNPAEQALKVRLKEELERAR